MICCMTCCMTFIDIIFLHHAFQSRSGKLNMIGMQYEDGDNISSPIVGP